MLINELSINHNISFKGAIGSSGTGRLLYQYIIDVCAAKPKTFQKPARNRFAKKHYSEKKMHSNTMEKGCKIIAGV